jgi:hypothetical protein
MMGTYGRSSLLLSFRGSCAVVTPARTCQADVKLSKSNQDLRFDVNLQARIGELLQKGRRVCERPKPDAAHWGRWRKAAGSLLE